MSFQVFADAINKRFNGMSKNELYVVGDHLDKDSGWLTFLDAFPEGTNEIFRTRREYDCSTCRQWLKTISNTIEIVDNQVRTVWGERHDLLWSTGDMATIYDVVAEKMNEFVLSLPLSGIFRSTEKQFGNKTTRSLYEGNVETFHHFYSAVADKHYVKKNATRLIGEQRSEFDSAVQVFERGLKELSSSAIDTVIELIDSNNLYRGEEHLPAITAFRSLQNKYKQIPDVRGATAFIYANANNPAARFRNTVIGTLIQDISNGVDLEAAVRSFESKVAPQNYRRPKSLITPKMVSDAMATINELGIERSLERRFAVLSDVSVNDVIWVNNETKDLMRDGGIADLLMGEAKKNVSALSKNAKPEPMSIQTFIKDILPGAGGVELLVKNNHANNFVSLTTSAHSDAPLIFSWSNPFAWSYNNNVTDSIKEKVKAAGGSVTGQLRVSLSWRNTDDLDLHLIEPSGNEIYYGNKAGRLDVDMNVSAHEAVKDAVENISYPTRASIRDGEYKIFVNNYTRRNSSDVGFTIEIESEGKLESYSYGKLVKNNVDVGVLTMRNGSIVSFKPAKDIVGGSVSKEVWGVQTEQFHKVNGIFLSPNHWGDNAQGNKHYIFALDGCINSTQTRGIYNEHLKGSLNIHRKVFEVLGSKTLIQSDDKNQLSGLGFSSTLTGASIVAKVSGSRNRLVEIQF